VYSVRLTGPGGRKGVTMGQETIKAKLRKIAALAERGVGGEKENAKRLLETLLARHHLTLADVMGPVPQSEQQVYWFACKSKMEEDVLFGCYFRALNQPKVSYYQGRAKIGFFLSALDALELQNMWEHFRPLLRQEFNRLRQQFGQAFACKHDLHCRADAAQDHDHEPLSQAEINTLINLMHGMEETNYVSTRRKLAAG
jgi:hypothetical protein